MTEITELQFDKEGYYDQRAAKENQRVKKVIASNNPIRNKKGTN